ncbi:ArfGap-domain-containing protein [Serendipita vermifera]|nr:ArfGap-domain-containing protein [Serendipita vermifera]
MSKLATKLTTDRATRMLNDLMALPGNDICADCKGASPRWASYNLGIFLCMSCASIHRKMGTHISKVKSLNMDQWTKEQIDAMKVTGNLNSNAIYNPTNVDPPVNLHDSERDSELEKYIRNKYQFRKFMNPRGVSSSTSYARDSLDSRSSVDSSNTRGNSSASRDTLTVTSPPARSSSSPQPQPKRASPALTTKSPAPEPSVSPAIPTPSPSIPTQPPLQILTPSPQPPLQILAPSNQPPLQILAPSPGLMQPVQTGLMPGYQPSAFTGGMMGATIGASPLPLQPQLTALPGSSPVWQDMAAIQSGPSMPVLQPQTMMTGYNTMSNMPATPMSGGWTGTNMVPTTMTGVPGIATTPMSAGFALSPMSMGQVNPTGGTFAQMTGMPTGMAPGMQQPMYGMQSPQQMASFQQQQQFYQQPLSPQPQMGQTLYVSDGVIVGTQPQGQPNPMMQPSPIQGMNPGMWAPQGGYGAQGQWHG